MASRLGLPGLPGRALGLPGATGLLGVNIPLVNVLSALLPSPSRSWGQRCTHRQACVSAGRLCQEKGLRAVGCTGNNHRPFAFQPSSTCQLPLCDDDATMLSF